MNTTTYQELFDNLNAGFSADKSMNPELLTPEYIESTIATTIIKHDLSHDQQRRLFGQLSTFVGKFQTKPKISLTLYQITFLSLFLPLPKQDTKHIYEILSNVFHWTFNGIEDTAKELEARGLIEMDGKLTMTRLMETTEAGNLKGVVIA